VGWKAELRGVTLGQFPETPDGEIETGRRRAAMAVLNAQKACDQDIEMIRSSGNKYRLLKDYAKHQSSCGLDFFDRFDNVE